jgi:hypothetical protein
MPDPGDHKRGGVMRRSTGAGSNFGGDNHPVQTLDRSSASTRAILINTRHRAVRIDYIQAHGTNAIPCKLSMKLKMAVDIFRPAINDLINTIFSRLA